MEFSILLTVLALASTAEGAALFSASSAGTGSDATAFRSGSIPDSGNNFNSGADGSFGDFQQQSGQGFSQSFGDRGNIQTFGSAGQDGQRFFQNSPFATSNVQTNFAPQYEEHEEPRAGVVPVTTTITNRVTQTHTLRVPSTSDVWVTSVTMMKMPVTHLATQRSYVPVAANTVTSVVRITKTPIAVVTRTEEIYPTKTLVSVFTRFVTETDTVELWQNIVHRATKYEVLTVPVVETQTLLQRLFTTTTVTRVVNVTSVQPLFTQTIVPRTGLRTVVVTSTAAHTYGR